MKKIILHIGMGKTGSSYLQSILALNTETLKSEGIYYPEHDYFSMVKHGYATSGNGYILLKGKIDFTGCETLLFSGESLYTHIQNDFLTKLVEEYNLKKCKLKAILYIRNIFEYSFSWYFQEIKRQGMTKDVNSFFNYYPMDRIYRFVLFWVEKSKECGFDLSVKNYSNHRNNMKSLFLRDLVGPAVDPSKFQEPPHPIVNRSLTFAECEVQRIFNAVEGEKSRHYISEGLVFGFPDIAAQRLTIKSETYDAFVEKVAPVVETINKLIDPAERLVIEDRQSVVSDSSELQPLTNDQVTLLGENIRRRFGLPSPTPQG